MGKRLRCGPSPAMLVALAGLVAATTGDAIADGARAVASVVGKDQVTSRSVKDNSLLLRDLKRSERAKLRGPRGAKGEPGVNALGKPTRKTATFAVPPAGQAPCPGTPSGSNCYVPIAQYATGTATCDPGQLAIGGGLDGDDIAAPFGPRGAHRTDLTETQPTPDGTGWTATVGNDDPTQPHSFTVIVLCVPRTSP